MRSANSLSIRISNAALLSLVGLTESSKHLASNPNGWAIEAEVSSESEHTPEEAIQIFDKVVETIHDWSILGNAFDTGLPIRNVAVSPNFFREKPPTPKPELTLQEEVKRKLASLEQVHGKVSTRRSPSKDIIIEHAYGSHLSSMLVLAPEVDLSKLFFEQVNKKESHDSCYIFLVAAVKLSIDSGDWYKAKNLIKAYEEKHGAISF